VLANPEKFALKLGVWYMYSADQAGEHHYSAHTLAGQFEISKPELRGALEDAGLAGSGIRHTSSPGIIAKLLPDPQHDQKVDYHTERAPFVRPEMLGCRATCHLSGGR
jgi:hypothetical protein